MDTNADQQIQAVVHAWETALANHDAEALLACYAPRTPRSKVRSPQIFSVVPASSAATTNFDGS